MSHNVSLYEDESDSVISPVLKRSMFVPYLSEDDSLTSENALNSKNQRSVHFPLQSSFSHHEYHNYSDEEYEDMGYEQNPMNSREWQSSPQQQFPKQNTPQKLNDTPRSSSSHEYESLLQQFDLSNILSERKEIDKKSKGSISLTENQWKDLVSRLSRPYQKKEQKIQKILDERAKQDQETHTFRPSILPKSKKLATHHVSIADRTRDIVDEKNQKVNEMKKRLKESEEVYPFKPVINKTSRSINRSVETFFAWNEERNKKRERRRKQKEESELGEISFKPHVCGRTEKIMSRKKKKGLESVWDRNYGVVKSSRGLDLQSFNHHTQSLHKYYT